MTQLSEDCFAFGGDLLRVEAALARIEERVARVVESETVPLDVAAGRILARDVTAPFGLPPHANSAVDGYAFAHADLVAAGETGLPVAGRAAAGHPLGRPLARAEAIRIFTGAPMPEGADTVAMQEDCAVEDGRVRLPAGLRRGANRREAGEDVAAGALALAAGRRLAPADLGLLAALGQAEIPVYRPLRAALLSTGDEIREPGAPLPPGAIYDANRFMLRALLVGLGCAVDDLGIRPDRADALADTFAAAAAGHDLIVTSGGVSTGEEDHVKPVIERFGSLYFWRLAMKPGRPVALGQVNGVPLVGLPGNPVAVFVTFALIARPLILKLAGAVARQPFSFAVPAGFSHRKKGGRREYLRARLELRGSGLVAIKYPKDGAGILSSVVQSDGLVVLDEARRSVEPGEPVDFLPFSEIVA